MINTDYLWFLCLAWLVVVGWLTYYLSHSRYGSAGIPQAYVLTMTLVYCGAFVYLRPTYQYGSNPYLRAAGYTPGTVLNGFEQAFIGLVGFFVGVWCVEQFSRRITVPRLNFNVNGIAKILILGSACAFVITKFLPAIPSVTSILNAATSVVLTGICLGLWQARISNNRQQKLFFLTLSLVVPAVYLVFFGFASYGAMAMLIILSFFFSQERKLKAKRVFKGALVALLFTYASLSMYVAYMTFRSELRAVIWGGKSVAERVVVVFQAASAIGPFDPWSDEHLHLINVRLNQGVLVGQAIATLEANPSLFANGSTIVESAFAWVPRVLWPSKPKSGGSGFASKFTGNFYDNQTTVGTGPIFEFYANFGTCGVFFGMLCIGYLVRQLDKWSMVYLAGGNLPMFIMLHIVAIQILNPMQTLFFMVASVVGAIVLGCVIRAMLTPRSAASTHSIRSRIDRPRGFSAIKPLS